MINRVIVSMRFSFACRGEQKAQTYDKGCYRQLTRRTHLRGEFIPTAFTGHTSRGLQGLQEFYESFLVALGELCEAPGDFLRFTAVSRNGVAECQ